MGAASGGDKELTDVKSQETSRAQRLTETLKVLFAPSAIEVIDQSAGHAGHAGAHPDGETHFFVKMTSAAFAGQNRVARQRAVMDALKSEFAAGLHALAMELKAPGE
jgi:BolA family transcriptional regulator, general stress-responsive regulator